MSAAEPNPTAIPTDSAAPRAGVARLLAAFVACFAVAIAVYSPALDGKFVSDDLRFIANNGANLDLLDRPWRFFLDPDTISNPPDRDIYRPLRTLSFAIDRAIAGESTRAFHLHNLALHALCTVLLWRWLRGIPGAARGAPFAAALFLLHPLATEAVAWISSRSDLQAAALVLAALLVAARRGSAGRLGAFELLALAVLAFLAGLAKETAVVLPALLFVDRVARGGTFRDGLAGCVALALGVAVYLALYLAVRARGITGQVDWYGGSFASHLPYALLGIGAQLRMLFWPSRFNFIHEPALFDPRDRASLAIAAAFVAGAIVAALLARNRLREASCGIVFHAIALLPAANLVLPLRSVLAERFAYLPLCGFALAVSAVVARASALTGSRRALLVLPAALVLIGAAGRTFERAKAFATPSALYAATLQDWPDSYSAALGLGDAALRESRFEESRAAFTRAIALATEAGDARLLRRAEYALGRSRLLARDFFGASAILAPLVAAFDADPRLAAELPAIDADARHALATAYSLSARLDAAAAVLDGLIAKHGETAERLDARAEVERARAGDGNLVHDLLIRAIALDPDHAKARIHLAKFYFGLTGFEREALRQLREVLAREPANAEAQALLDEYSR